MPTYSDDYVHKLEAENKRLQETREELASSVRDLGRSLFGPTWRQAKAKWWLRCIQAVEATE